MRLAIVGSRDYPDLFQVHAYLDWYCAELAQYAVEESYTAEGQYEPGYDPMPILISGGARGVDQEAVQYGLDAWNLLCVVHYADWDKYGKGAGFIRNQKIVDDADKVVAFWDGISKGTKHTIDLALKRKKSLEVIFP